MTTTAQNFLTANFSSRFGRLTDPVIDSFDRLGSDSNEAKLTTIAFLFGNGDPLKLNTLGLQTMLLSLYAAGADVRLTREELWELSTEVRKFCELFALPENVWNPNGKVLRFVFNQAMQRAAREAIPSGSKTDLPVGFKLIRLQSSACRLPAEDDETRQLLTIAFTNLHTDPMLVSPPSLAVAMLAIWASGAAIGMSDEQYGRLKDKAELLANCPVRKGSRLAFQSRQAGKVLEKAAVRALQEGILP